MNPKDVVDCIEGTPHISTIPVEPGLTNAASEKNGERLVGFNTENEEINEGLIRFDIVFYVIGNSYHIKRSARIALRRLGSMSQKRPAAGGESRKQDSFSCAHERWIVTDYHKCRSTERRADGIRNLKPGNLLCEQTDLITKRT